MTTTAGQEPAPDFLDYTIEVFQPYAKRDLTREDAREITHNVVGLFRLLAKWDQRDRAHRATQGGGHD